MTTGRLVTASGAGRCVHVLREDCAAADAGALVSRSVANMCIDVTGPEGLSVEDVMQLVSQRYSRPVEVRQVSAGELGEELTASNMDPAFIPIFAAYDEAVSRGLYDGPTDAVLELSGRAPTTLSDFLATYQPAAAG